MFHTFLTTPPMNVSRIRHWYVPCIYLQKKGVDKGDGPGVLTPPSAKKKINRWRL